MKAWIKGALIGFISFIIFFVVMSLINTGEIDFFAAFISIDAEVLINYLLVLLFILVGAGIANKISKNKSKNKKGKL